MASAKVIVSNDISSAASSFAGSGTLPVLKRINGATDKMLILSWVASGVEEVQFGNIALPPDYDNTQALEVHLLVYKSANVNTGAVIDVQAWSGIGDTEMGGNTAAITETTAAEKTVSLTGANVGAAPGVVTIGLVPGAHTSDTVNLLAIWIEYQRKS